MGIKTSVLPFRIMDLFVKDVGVNSNYYIFISSLTNTPVSINSQGSARKFLEKTIFGKKLTAGNVKYMIKKNIWYPGVVYDQYDDEKDLSTSNYYVISEPDSDSGDYHVFKCLYNNRNAPSTDKPTFNSDLVLTDYILRTSDNYKWKLMYTVKSAEYDFYGTNHLFPVIDTNLVQTNNRTGIDTIEILNAENNSGYESLSNIINSTGGTISGSYRFYLNVSDSQIFNKTAGYYTNYVFYVTSSNGITSRLYTISNSGARSSDQRPFVDILNYDGQINDVSTIVWTYSILPRVQITGDGTGAVAIPVLSGSSITRIEILSPGQGYTRAIAKIVKPNLGFDPAVSASGDVTCKLRVLLSPYSTFGSSGGHGSNIPVELNARHLMLTTELNMTDNLIVPTSNKYSKIGIVRNPTFTQTVLSFDNRIKVRLASVALLSPGNVVTQDITNFRGIIHSVDSINNFVYLTEFFGPYFDQSETNDFYLSSGIIDPTLPLSSSVGNIDIVDQAPTDNGVIYPFYVQNSGEVLYISDFDPVERINTSTEQFKFILEF